MDVFWKKWREQFPALGRYCYLNTASTGVVSQRAATAGARQFSDSTQFGGVPLPQWREQMEEVRSSAAELVGVSADEVAFTPSTSYGMNIIAQMLSDSKRRRIVVSELEFPSSTLPFLRAGFDVVFVRGEGGAASIERYAEVVDENTVALVASVTQFSSGWRNDPKELAEVAKRHGAFLILNLTQTAGSFSVNLKEADADFACYTGVKWLCAGETMGILYVRRGLLDQFEPPLFGWLSAEEPYLMDNRRLVPAETARRFEVGSLSFPSIFALGEAIRLYFDVGPEKIEERTLELSKSLATKLLDAGFEVLTPFEDEKHRSGIISFSVPDAENVVERLRNMGVIVSFRRGAVRASVHYYNTEEDIERLITALKEIHR